jgi:hypothetical protein
VTPQTPTKIHRLLVALPIAAAAAAMHFFAAGRNGSLSDFSILWFGSRVLASGGNPYSMIGPHSAIDLPSAVFYPAPALVATMPFTLIPVQFAGTVFVFISAALLAFGVTRDGWHRLPIFPSVAFMTSARLGQVSSLMCAALFIPALTFFSVVKPQASIPILGASSRSREWIIAATGAAVLTAISFAMFPEWPGEWWNTLSKADYFRPPIMTLPGALTGLVMLRWRRPEGWLVFLAACLPQTWYPYNGLILLTVAATYREASLLSLTSSLAWLVTYAFLVGEWRSPETRAVMQNVLIGFGYLPAVLVILRRPNIGPEPFWVRWLMNRKIAHGD